VVRSEISANTESDPARRLNPNSDLGGEPWNAASGDAEALECVDNFRDGAPKERCDIAGNVESVEKGVTQRS